MGTGHFPDLEEARSLATQIETKPRVKPARVATVLRTLADELHGFRTTTRVVELEAELQRLRGIVGDLGGESPSTPVAHREG